MGVLQVHESYLVTQDDQGMLIIDQHALHERVMFEELRQRITHRPLESQRLLMPAVIHTTAVRIELLEDLQPLLERIGIEAGPIGPGAIGIQAFPTLLFERKVEPVAFFEDLLDKAQEGLFDISSPAAVEASLHEVLDMMACKAAVKAGDKLSTEELASLLARRQEIERSSSCPHGRPTTIRLTLRDLEKHFKRT
jgi:DNA mismatch repair protein MutL